MAKTKLRKLHADPAPVTVTIVERVDKMRDRLAEILADLQLGCVDSNVVTQDSLASLKRVMDVANKLAGFVEDTKKSMVQRHKDHDLSVEAGKFVLSIEEGEQRRPAWQAEAVEKARNLAALAGTAFNETAYIESIKVQTKPTPVIKFQVIEGV